MMNTENTNTANSTVNMDAILNAAAEAAASRTQSYLRDNTKHAIAGAIMIGVSALATWACYKLQQHMLDKSVQRAFDNANK